jgi:hypothetical protein
MCAVVAPFTSHREKTGKGRLMEMYVQIIPNKLTFPGFFSLELVELPGC